jgi:hypothetical protein
MLIIRCNLLQNRELMREDDEVRGDVGLLPRFNPV